MDKVIEKYLGFALGDIVLYEGIEQMVIGFDDLHNGEDRPLLITADGFDNGIRSNGYDEYDERSFWTEIDPSGNSSFVNKKAQKDYMELYSMSPEYFLLSPFVRWVDVVNVVKVEAPLSLSQVVYKLRKEIK